MPIDAAPDGCTFAPVTFRHAILFAFLVLGHPLSYATTHRPAIELIRERAPQEDRLIAINRSIFPISAAVRLTALENATVLDHSDSPRTVAPLSELLLARVVSEDPQVVWRYEHDFRWYPGAMETQHAAQVIYELPYAEAEAHRVLQGFDGEFSHRGTFAIDWAMPIETRVMATRSGRVILVVDNHPEGAPDPAKLGLANRIWILHKDGSVGVYAHLLQRGAQVVPGQRVETGEWIGLSGNSGYSSRPHLHFDVRAGAADEQARTFPIVFYTARSPIAVPIADVSYMRPVASGATPRLPTNFVRSLEILASGAGTPASKATDRITSDDRIAVRIRIGAPARHDLRVAFYRDDSEEASAVRTLRTKHDQELLVVRFDPSAFPDPAGSWRVRVLFDELVLAERRFEISAED